MHSGNEKLDFRISSNFRNIALGLIGVGLLLTLVQIFAPWHSDAAAHGAGHGEEHAAGNPRLFFSLHLALLVGFPLALGGIWFTALHHLSGAAWSTTVRRISENFFWSLPVLFVLLLITLFAGMGDVFHHWVHADPEDALLKGKSAWLNPTFFSVRNIAVFIVWFAFGLLFWKASVTQDSDGAFSHTSLMTKLSAAFMIVFGLTVSSTGWDLSMSMEPHWFSTMWGVYIFAGAGLSSFAAMILWIWYLKRSGYVSESINIDHIHDVAKWMWGFTGGWAYIGVASQFMLIWYAHIPEETIFFHTRLYHDDGTYNAWALVSLILVLVRWTIPFFTLIRRDAKRNLNWLAANAVLILFGQVLDMYWVMYPTLDHGEFHMLSWYEIGPLALLAGSFMITTAWGLSRAKLVPQKDPRLEECLHAHH